MNPRRPEFCNNADYQAAVVGMVGREDQSVNVIAAQAVQVIKLTLDPIDRRTEYDTKAMLVGRRFDRTGQGREERKRARSTG